MAKGNIPLVTASRFEQTAMKRESGTEPRTNSENAAAKAALIAMVRLLARQAAQECICDARTAARKAARQSRNRPASANHPCQKKKK
jgi:hypothetical protein